MVHRRSPIATAEGRLADRAGELIAHGNTTIMILSAKPAPWSYAAPSSMRTSWTQ